MKTDAWIERHLEALSFVEWDRYIPFDAGLSVYGWIDRDDDYRDFLIIHFYPAKRGLWWQTSSAERHDEIHEILHGEDAGPGNACERVEDRFDVENAIELADRP